MNDLTADGRSVLDTALNHRSIRKYRAEAVGEDIMTQILEAGRAASSSSFMQCVHIVRVRDAALRDTLCRIAAGQKYVRDAPEFLVFCIDYSKHADLVPQIQTGYTEAVLLGAVDAGIMAQNVLLAAESLGLGGVYIGSLRNDITAAAEALALPDTAVPLFGMCLGYPDQSPLYRPRLPLSCLVSENRYRRSSAAELAQYDRVVADYYARRGHAGLDWKGQIADTLGGEVRPHILPFFRKRKMMLK